MIRNLPAIIVILCALTVIVGASMGAHIYRWEAIVWPGITILWVITAMIYKQGAKS